MPVRPATSPAPDDLPIQPHNLVKTSPRLSAALEEFVGLGASSFGALYERQNLGPDGPRTVLGPPGRREFNAVTNTCVPVINLASTGYLTLGNDPRVKQSAASA